MANYLLDTNYLIYLYNSNEDQTKRQEVLKDLEKILDNNDSRFAITPLIRYEVLRGIKWEDPEKLQAFEEILKQFQSFEIRDEIADLARDLYRFDRYQAQKNNIPKNLEKRKFDMFHYATAHIEQLEILSEDGHLEDIQTLHQQLNTE